MNGKEDKMAIDPTVPFKIEITTATPIKQSNGIIGIGNVIGIGEPYRTYILSNSGSLIYITKIPINEIIVNVKLIKVKNTKINVKYSQVEYFTDNGGTINNIWDYVEGEFNCERESEIPLYSFFYTPEDFLRPKLGFILHTLEVTKAEKCSGYDIPEPEPIIVGEIPVPPIGSGNEPANEIIPPHYTKETDDGAILFTYNFITKTWSIDHTDRKSFNFLVDFNKRALMVSDYGIYKMDYEKASDGNMSYFILPLFDGGVQKLGKLFNKITIDFIGTVKLEYEPYPKDKWNRKGYQRADVLHINPLFKTHKNRDKCSFYIPLQDMHIQDNHLKHIRVYFNDTIYGMELQSENFSTERAT